MATYAIGDIQGCMSALSKLLDLIHFSPGKDKLWLVGDLVNRGPGSLTVLRYIKDLGQSAVTVLGNHDLHLLAVASGITRLRKNDTLHEILSAVDCDELVTWLRRRPLLHRENGLALVHAGLLPLWTIDMAAGLASEAEKLLSGEEYRDLLRTIYKTSLPTRWSDELSGTARLGVITNVFTKLRVCTSDGDMDFSFKGELRQIPSGLSPWFRMPDRQNIDTAIVCGHWAALGLHLDDNIIALDTGCVWGRLLTAVRLEDRQIFQVPCSDSSR